MAVVRPTVEDTYDLVPAGEPAPEPAGEPAPSPVEDRPEPAGEPAPRPAGPPMPDPVSWDGERLVRWAGDEGAPWVPLVEPRPLLSVHAAVAEVTRRVGHISKDRQATSGGTYKYRGIDDVLEALHPLLGEVGLLILPAGVDEAVWETRATAGGGTLNVARIKVRYLLVGPDGSTLPAEVWGEGGDSGDKATQKAHSQSYKTMALQVFSIPTEQSAADEPDATNPPSRPFTADEQQRAVTAYTAGTEAGTLEQLSTVRARAVRGNLLAVPVRMADDSLTPLGILFDGLRARLEQDASAAGGGS